ncbi:hypothetical protein LGT39_13945 [Demequina sp. TTPB684]|uniref:hypothetical protein n=1 Tax=unclassified Demequina TaxID=2620311 RepID=UPI001CF2641C|nr:MULTISPECIES: hypothetical protein [unclassified Demequina]MCB2413949.1 hypothetical protein [Demequina sp. TTPB684]UPU88698.1 hypothetical protein LGT36_001885 [Demequina sp. TMPB413]
MRGIGTLAVTAVWVTTTTGCSHLYEEATDAARDHMAQVHVDTVSCLTRGVAADPEVDRVRQLISMSCTGTRSEEPADEQTVAASFQEGSWLLDLDESKPTWNVEVLDVGYATRSQAHDTQHRAVIQCWTTTVSFEPTAMTPPAKLDCPVGVEGHVVGRDALEVDSLVTTAPSWE